MNVTEREASTPHDPAIPALLAAPLCLALDLAGLAWQAGACAVDVTVRLGAWTRLACRHVEKPPDL